MAMIVVVRMSDAPAMRLAGADIELNRPRIEWIPAQRADPSRVRPDPQMVSGILACERCVLIKLILRLLRCRKVWIGKIGDPDWTLIAFDRSP
jgi:hypothetical protein